MADRRVYTTKSKRPRRKRLDGNYHLTAEQKAERDARATRWMNQRKIEQVYRACVRARLRQIVRKLS